MSGERKKESDAERERRIQEERIRDHKLAAVRLGADWQYLGQLSPEENRLTIEGLQADWEVVSQEGDTTLIQAPGGKFEITTKNGERRMRRIDD